MTANVTVEVNTLVIDSQPQSLTTNNSNGANVSVSATASGAASYQWYRNSSAITGAISPSYLAAQDGSYHVVVTSTLNGVARSITSNTASFAINSLSISDHPTSALIGDSETATFAVSATGSGTLTYQWTRNDTNISGANSSSYTTDVAGAYKVQVTSTLNGVSRNLLSNSAALSVNTVSITSQSSDVSMTQGESRTLAVTVSSQGSATISYQWFRNNVSISGATSISYSVTQDGTYKVRVISTRGGTTATRFSSDVVVTEVAPATISSVTASPTSIAVGSSTSITAVFSGGTAVLTPGNVSLTSGTGVSVSPSTTTLYTVTATNAAGQQATFTINIVVTSGTFNATANTGSTNRWYGSIAVTLQNGKVLVFGSGPGNGAITDLYDPTTNSFTRVGDMRQSRESPSVVLLPNGKVLAIGGRGGGAFLATAELYDPATETWSYTGSLTTARSWGVAVLLPDGRVLITGGITNGNTRLTSTEIYDPESGFFVTMAPMPQARQGASGTLMADGNVFIAGGGNGTVLFQSAVIYNVSTDTWTTISSQMNATHTASSSSPGGISLLLPDGRILIAGGWASNTGVTTMDIYDPATDTFAANGSIPQFSYGGSATGHVMNNGLVVFFGGSGSGTVSSYASVYDPISNTMTLESNTMSSWRYMHSSAKLNDGRIVVIGGTNVANATADVYTQ